MANAVLPSDAAGLGAKRPLRAPDGPERPPAAIRAGQGIGAVAKDRRIAQGAENPPGLPPGDRGRAPAGQEGKGPGTARENPFAGGVFGSACLRHGNAVFRQTPA